MMTQSTGLLSRDLAKQYAADVKAMARNGYLREANIVLKDAAGEVIRAAKYEVSTDASTLTAQRPGNNLWPRTPDGDLSVIVQYSRKWKELTQVERDDFRRSLGIGWGPSDTDLSFPSLTRAADRNYVSNGWGVAKAVFS
jgi:hypothetical protein